MVAFAGLGAIASALSGVVSAVGAISAASAQASAAEYNARLAERDAIIVDQNRKAAINQADIDAEDHRRQTRRMMSAIRASYGASGLELAGSPLDVLQDTAIERELDTRRIQYEGRVRGREGAIKMLGLEEEATLSRMRGKSDKAAGTVSAFGSLLGGAGSALSRLS